MNNIFDTTAERSAALLQVVDACIDTAARNLWDRAKVNNALEVARSAAELYVYLEQNEIPTMDESI